MMKTTPSLGVVLFCLSSCAIAPSELPDSRDMVTVKGVRIPNRSWLPWIARFADHLWIDLKSRDGWWRVEWNSHGRKVRVARIPDQLGREDERWGMEVRVVDWFSGVEARKMAQRILELAPTYPDRDGYRAWPGPNSNTLIEWLARETPGMWVDLPTTAAGKDYVTWVRAGVSPTRTGLELETSVLGVEIGLREGVELHLLGLTIGVGLWPPSIKLPFLPALPFDMARRGTVVESTANK